MQNRVLYVVVSKFPFGDRETFFEPELEVLAKNFERIFIVIPEGQSIGKEEKVRKIPSNVSILLLKIQNKGLAKFAGVFSILASAIREEYQFIHHRYGLKFGLHHLRVLLGFSSMATQFANQIESHIQSNGFAPKQVSLYTYWFTYATAGIALLKVREPALKAVTRVHGWDCFFERSPDKYLPLRPWVIQRLDLTAPVSKKGEKYLLELLGTERFEDKIQSHYLGIGSFEKPAIRASYPKELHLVSIAFIDPVKQLEIIADSLTQVSGLIIRWTHIGGGTGLPAFKQYVIQKTKSSNHIQVSFLGDLTQHEVYVFLREENPDALLCTSRSEGLPVSMMEAMAHGIPVISADVGGVHEIVQDAYNGILLPEVVSAKDLAAAIQRFAELPDPIRRQWQENAYTTYIQHFVAARNYEIFVREALT